MTIATGSMAADRGILTERGGMVTEYWRPLVWSAIFGGMIAALGVQIIFALFGIGIGMAIGVPQAAASASNPFPSVELGFASVIWLVGSGIVSFGAGGWVAGRMSGYLRTGTGAMHGIAAWALAAVLGAAVTAFAGAPVLGGVAAGAGAHAARMTSAMTQGGPMGRDASAPSSGADTRPSDAWPSLSEEEFRVQADEARREAGKVALCTGTAFLLSMVAAGFGGTLGRKSFAELKAERRQAGRSPVLS